MQILVILNLASILLILIVLKTVHQENKETLKKDFVSAYITIILKIQKEIVLIIAQYRMGFFSIIILMFVLTVKKVSIIIMTIISIEILKYVMKEIKQCSNSSP